MNYLPAPFIFKVMFRIFQSPKYRDAFYPIYFRFVRDYLGIEVYHSNQIRMLKNIYPSQVEVIGDSAILHDVIVLDNGIIRIRDGVYYLKDYYWYYTFLINLRNITGKIVCKQRLNNATFMVGSYSNDFNIFHFFTDSIMTNLSEDMKIEEFPPIMSNIKNSFQKEVLNALNIKEYYSACDGPTYCSNLHVADFNNKWSQHKMELFRNKLGVVNNNNANKTIYISRKGRSRKIDNENQVINFLQDRNVNIIDFAELTLQERKDLLSETNILIGQYGAGLTNLIFMPSGSRVIDIEIGNWVKEDYCTLSYLCGHKYLFLPLPIKVFSNYKHYRFTSDDFYRLGMLLDVARG